MGALVLAGACGDEDFCGDFDLVEDETGSYCTCPEGSAATADGDGCIFPDGGSAPLPGRTLDASVGSVPDGGVDANRSGDPDGATSADAGCDIDGDGVLSIGCGGMDCDDGSEAVFPGQVEVCNGLDDDCDGDIDEQTAAALDVLFVVGSNVTVTEERILTGNAVRTMMEIVQSGDIDGDGLADVLPVEDLHVGVVSGDLGLGNRVPGCTEEGANAALNSVRDGEGCPDIAGSFVDFQELERDSAEVACRIRGVGAESGCGIWQPLEAALRALTPSTSTLRFFRDTTGQGDLANAGFRRPEAALALIFVGNRDDCSMATERLFAAEDEDFGATPLSQRCVVHEDEALQSLGRYSDGITDLVESRSLVIGTTGGLPAELGMPLDSESRLGAILDLPEMTPQLTALSVEPVCSEVGIGDATPARRLLQWMLSMSGEGARVVADSSCRDSYDAMMRRLGSLIALTAQCRE